MIAAPLLYNKRYFNDSCSPPLQAMNRVVSAAMFALESLLLVAVCREDRVYVPSNDNCTLFIN